MPRLWLRRKRSATTLTKEASTEDGSGDVGSTASGNSDRRRRRAARLKEFLWLGRNKARLAVASGIATTEGTASTVNDDDEEMKCNTCKRTTRRNEVEAVKVEGSLLLRILQPEPPRPSKKTSRQLTLEFMKCYNRHDLKAARDMVSDDYLTTFGEHEMNWDDLAVETKKIFDAFPDYRFTFQKAEERGDDVVVLHHFITYGTHTGKAYAFGPCEEIQPTGKYVRNDPEEVHFVWNSEGKLSRNKVFSHGDMIGPAGIYFQIGGFPMV